MRRSVLLVTPYFAPQSHAAMFRVHKLAKYLPRFGWKPYVLTVDANYLYQQDPGLLEDLPPEVEVIRTRYIEPTLRGIRMALGGRDRSFAARRSSGELPVSPGEGARGRSVSVGRRAYDHVLQRWVHVPDPYWTWYPTAVRAGAALVRRHGIPLVYSTCYPFSCHRVGRALQRRGCRWVADFRDPAVYSARTHSAWDRVYLRQRRIERETVLEADAVTVLSSAYALIFRDMYGVPADDRVHFIPTGADDDLLPRSRVADADADPIVFVGEYQPEYGDRFLSVFAGAAGSDALRKRPRLILAGHELINRQRTETTVRRLGIEPFVEYRDHMPQGDLYRLIAGCRAGVLIPGSDALWWTNFAKMVDYIALRKPVLALVPDPSEARTQLVRTGLGVFLDGGHDAAVSRLVAFLDGEEALRVDPVACDRYLASRQTSDFVTVFERLLEQHPMRGHPTRGAPG